MPTATVTSKGQITIPAEVRKSLGLKAGVQVLFFEGEKGEYIFRPRSGSIWDLRGCVPRLDHPVSIEEMNEGIAEAAVESYVKSVGEQAEKPAGKTDNETA
jgi:AbrB family looped-hinge helix DNA binding protein